MASSGRKRLRDAAARLAIAVAVAAAAGCGSADGVDLAGPETFRLDWHDRDAGLAYSVRSIEFDERGWRVSASIVNESQRVYVVSRRHRPGDVLFALLPSVSRPRAQDDADPWVPYPAAATHPRVRNALAPGERWSGTFSGLGRFPRGTYVRVVFGLFAPPGEPTHRFAVITTHWIRLRR